MLVGRQWKWLWVVGGLISIALGASILGISFHSVADAHQVSVQFRPFGGGLVLLGIAELFVGISGDSAFAAACAFIASLLCGYALVFGGWIVK